MVHTRCCKILLLWHTNWSFLQLPECTLLAYLGLTQVRKNYLARQIPQLLALLEISHKARIEVSPEVAGEGVGTRFVHRRDVLDVVWGSHAILQPRTTPDPHRLEYPYRTYYRLNHLLPI